MILVILVTSFALVLILLASRGQSLSNALQRALRQYPGISRNRQASISACSAANSIWFVTQNRLAQIIILSIAMWFVSGVSQLATVHAFAGARQITLGGGVLLLGFGVLGALVQMPGGGNQQLITIAALVQYVWSECRAGGKLQHPGLAYYFYGAGPGGTRSVTARGINAARPVANKSSGHVNVCPKSVNKSERNVSKLCTRATQELMCLRK